MKDFFQRAWTPIAGAISSMSFKGIADISEKTPEMVESMQHVPHTAPLITYFYIGILGAVGGLLVKIIWCALKRIFPKIKNIDK